MSARNKSYIIATALLLLALGILLRPTAQRPVIGSDEPAERSRPVTRPPKPVTDPRRAKDFHTLARRLKQGEAPQLTRREIDDFLEARHRSAGSLVAAFRLSKDDAFIREAMERFPHDPQVLLAFLESQTDPSKRLEILETLKFADPDNGLADCLSACVLFDLGKNDEAVAALSQSAGKPVREYNIPSGQEVEEAYLAAGFPPLEAKISSLYQITKPHLMQMRKVADGLKKERERDGSAGDEAAVQSSRDIQMRMAQELRKGPFVMDSLIAAVLELGILQEIDSPEARARIEEINLQRTSVSEGSKRISALMETSAVPENDWLLYFDRVKLFGEKAANDWMLGRYPNL
jgi:hypothetical protein